MTVPDQHKSIRELYQQWTITNSVSGQYRPGWGDDQITHDDVDFEKVPGLDITERVEVKEAYAKRAQEIEKEIRERQKKDAQKGHPPVDDSDEQDETEGDKED